MEKKVTWQLNAANNNKDWLMSILRFGEPNGNSSVRAFEERIRSLKLLSEDLRTIVNERRVPILDPSTAPIIEHWTIDACMAPMLTGFICDPERPDPKASQWLRFTAPLELLSVSEHAVRSMVRWYRLGSPSPLAEDSLKVWASPSTR